MVCTVFTFLKTQENGDDTDDEQENHPELRYGVYKNPIDGPSWRLEPGEYYNPAWITRTINQMQIDCQSSVNNISSHATVSQLSTESAKSIVSRLTTNKQVTVNQGQTTLNGDSMNANREMISCRGTTDCLRANGRLSTNIHGWLRLRLHIRPL